MSTKYSGLEAALRSARMTFTREASAGDLSGTEIVACEDLLPAWTKAGPKGDGSHEVGEACTHNGQSWRCCQAHNTNNNPDIEPGNSPAQWAPYHTTDPTKAKAFIQPTGAHDAYQKGECCLWTDGKVYRSIMDGANAYSPEAYPQGWEEVTAAGEWVKNITKKSGCRGKVDCSPRNRQKKKKEISKNYITQIMIMK